MEPAESPSLEPPSPSSAAGLVNLRGVEFVKQQPPHMPASEVVARAKELGLELELAQVYRIRERERVRAAKAAKTKELSAMSISQTDAKEESASEGEKAPNPIATKGRRGRKPGGQETKAGFVRAMPLDISAREVVERAKEQGHELTESYVYAIRSKLKQSPSPSKRGRPRKTERQPLQRPPQTSETPSNLSFTCRPAGVEVKDVEVEFARLVVEVGLVRAEQMLKLLKIQLAKILQSVEPERPG